MKTESYAKIENAPIPLYMNFSSWVIRLMRFGDNRVTGISSSGKIVYDNDFSKCAAYTFGNRLKRQ